MRLPHPRPLLAFRRHHRLPGFYTDAFYPSREHSSFGYLLSGTTYGQLDHESARRFTQVHPDHAVNKGDDQGRFLERASCNNYSFLDSCALDAEDLAY